jgi:hypothetical protein
MAIEVLILAQDRPGWRKKGYVIYEKDSPAVWGKMETLPDFIIITVTGAVTVEEARAYREQWRCHYDWTVDNHDVPNDEYRITIFGDKVNVSGEGALTKTKADNHLLPMGMVYVSEAPNALTYDFTVYGVLTSTWFWDFRSLLGVSFNEFAYDSGTGVHTVDADYSAPAWPEEKVAKTVERKGGVVVSNAGGVIRFQINRSAVNTALKDYFAQFVDDKVEERQFYVQSAYVDTVVSGGGLDIKTKAEFLALINNRLDE